MTAFISEKSVSDALHYLATSAPEIADAKMRRERETALLKSVRSELIRASDEKTVGAREAWAESQAEYREQISVMAGAHREFEFHRAKREAAIATIDAWRTMAASNRGAERMT